MSCLTGSSPKLVEHRRGPPVTVRVVIAEDEAIIRLDLKETLEQEGYQVVGETGRGDEAVAMVRDLQPDLAILDIKMPVMDGIAAAREIAVGRMAAVLILTAFSQRDLVQQATEAGAMNYLVKPFQTSALIPAIEVALARFAEVRALEQRSDELQETLDTRRLVHRAQGVLQDEHGMTEAEAFTFIQRTAMRLRAKMRVVAEQILAGTLKPEA
jgi:response regulator NasT